MPQTGKYSATDLQAPAQTGQYTAADIVPSASKKELAELDIPTMLHTSQEPPMMGYPMPTPGGAALGAVGTGMVQGAKAILPAAGATIEQTAANVTKWALEQGIKGGGIAGAWYLLHKVLGGGER